MAGMTLDELQSSLSGLESYTPETEDALRKRAESIYNPQYQRDLQDLRDNLQSALVQQNLNSVSTGMQRSSYNNAANAAIHAGGLRAQADLAGNYESSVAALLNDLIQGEKDRALAADQYRNNLLMQLYEYGNQGGGSGRGGSSSGVGDAAQKGIMTAAEKLLAGLGQTSVDMDIDALMGSMGTPKTTGISTRGKGASLSGAAKAELYPLQTQQGRTGIIDRTKLNRIDTRSINR